MTIERVIVQNYRSLKSADIQFQEGMNIIVGNNEVGKSTLIEAINLALRCQLNRRSAHQELHPFIINSDAVQEFIKSHRDRVPQVPPRVLIEIYIRDIPEFASLKGTNNSQKRDCPGIALSIQLDDERFGEEYKAYVSEPEKIVSVPIEYYEILWRSFANEDLSSRNVPIKTALVDVSAGGNAPSAQRYVLEVIRESLSKDQSAKLAIAYRGMREQFISDQHIEEINAELKKKKDGISEKELSVALDTTARASWEIGVIPHLNNIPFSLVGKGEQSKVKIKLAIDASPSAAIVLIEEPENHLSHTNLGSLTNNFSERCAGRQVIITTHSSFVMNKLGVESVIMFNGKTGISLRNLSKTTYSFFKRLPGHDTLRMLLAKKTILVEGPSDELIVQKGYLQKYKKLPLELGHEVISVGTSFKRFADIAVLLGLPVSVVMDNDGRSTRKREIYAEYIEKTNIQICIDDDDELKTLEPHLVHSNGREFLNQILGKEFSSNEELIDYMTANKTEVALQLFESSSEIRIPKYLEDAL